MAPRAIAVIGSLNVDFITRTPRLPAQGETLTATSFDTGFGGKGANQAVACARLGPDVSVSMVGRLGDDHFGTEYLALLKDEGIDVNSIEVVENTRTGIANIIVEEDGSNRILIAGNANDAFSRNEHLIPDAIDIAIFQLEIPLPVVLYNLHRSHSLKKHVILNPAPAVQLPKSAFEDINTLIMNETEADLLSEGSVDESGQKLALEDLPTHFLNLGVRDTVIITLGAKGVLYASRRKQGHVPAQKVEAIDTTAAGDTFLGAYTAHLAIHDGPDFDVEDALRFATAASAIAVQRKGAMAAIPHRTEVSVDS